MDRAPAWLADPTGRHEYRWWDGERWTEHVADGGQSAVDPLSGEAPPPGDTAPSGGEPSATGEPSGGWAGAGGDRADPAGEAPAGGGDWGAPPGGTSAPGGQQPGGEQWSPQQPVGQQPAGQQPWTGQPQAWSGQPGGGQPTWGTATPPGAAAPAPGGTDGFALTALILGIIALVVSWIPVVGLLLGGGGGLLALIFGFVGRSRARKRGTSGSGLAIGGIITGVLAIVVSVLITVVIVRGGIFKAFTDYAECIEETGDPEFCEQELERGIFGN